MRLSRKLMALGAFFVLALAVAGCGSGGLSGNSVATVAGNQIGTRAFDHWMFVAAKGNASQSPGAPVIVPNDPPSFASCIKQVRAQIPTLAKTPTKTLKAECGQLFTSLSSQVMDFLIKSYWYQLLAHKLHVKLTQAQLNSAFAQAKKQSNLTTAAALNKFLSTTGQTLADILYRVRVNELYKDLVARETKKVTPASIQAYYKAHPTQFGHAATRDLRIVRTNSKSAAQTAYSALKSGQSWQKVAKKYSVDTATKNNAGLLTGVTNGEEEHALNAAAFSAPENKLVGPIHGTFGWYVVEVVKITKGTQQSLTKATPLIKQLLTSQYQSAAATAIDKTAKQNWGAKTICRSAYSMADCKGYKAPKTSTGTSTATQTAPATTGTSTGSSTTGG
ncbi:MAG TPA: peptidyl-prolyl cis-trans isomerase [Solirubrobacteraceae bacterium]|jgi:foldase protein PrsA|nr:peptidyl-prolyl cis-trans isomerase [Solirubrobacteraceae bacterium]